MKYSNWIPFWMAAMLAAGIFIGVKFGQRAPHIFSDTDLVPNNVQNKLDEIMRYVNARYVEDVNQEQLMGNAIEEILAKLDPHSSYISTDQISAVNDDMDGDFEGIGIEYLMDQDTISVVATVPNGPSEQVGLHSGDKIITIEDSLVAGVKITPQKLFKKLRGKKGTEVRVAVLRGKDKLNFTITRDEIPTRSVDAGFMLDDKTGYIKVNHFAEKTYKEFMEKLDPMVSKQGMKNLVIDLRGNPGGYVSKAVDILNQFFKDKDKILVFTQGLHSVRNDYKTNSQAFYEIGKVVVLIDESSASASEIVAGALQDWDRAVIVGRRSYGKGLVQEQYPLSDGSALRLTVAQYFTPSKRCIQKPYKNNPDYKNDLENRIKNGDLLDEAKNRSKDSSIFYTASGRIVHGGGGIMPDLFVPIESHRLDNYYAELQHHTSQFALSYAQSHKSDFATDEATFLKTSLNEKVITDFYTYAKNHGIKPDKTKEDLCKNDMRVILKARIGKVLFNDETQYKAVLEGDKMIEKALWSITQDNILKRK
jgi:carboxyl-terminal processing protease